MADMLDSVRRLTSDKIWKLFSSDDGTQRKENLRVELGWSSFEDDDDLRRAALLDYFDETLKFAVERGLSWTKCYQFLLVCARILKNIKSDVTQVEIIEIFQRILFENSRNFFDNELKSLTDYVFVSILQHFKLFDYVLNSEREPMTVRLGRRVDPPETVLPTSSGLTKKIWDYKEKVKDIEMKKAAVVLSSYEKDRQRSHDEKPPEFHNLETSSNLNRDVIEGIIKECMIEHTDVLKEVMTSHLDLLQDRLLLELEKAELPRPRELGPRSPIPTPKSPRSPKSRSPKGSAKERKGSGKEKGKKNGSRPGSKTKPKI